MSPDKLIHMANQIGRFFAHEGASAPASIADHLRMFWDPGMRADIIGHVAAGAAGLEPQVQAAVRLLVEADPVAGQAAAPAAKLIGEPSG